MNIAFWCVFGAVLLPYVCFGIARNRGRDPQGGGCATTATRGDFPSRIEGLAKRAWDAQLNSFEALPGFAAAVIIAHLVRAPQTWIGALALAWIVARIAYVAFYLADKSTLRSTAQFASLACVVELFILAGLS